jgi:hypothetical protein
MIGLRMTLDPNRDMVEQMTAGATLTAAMNAYLECECDTFDCDHYRALVPLTAAVTGQDCEEVEAQARAALDLIDDRFESALRRVAFRLFEGGAIPPADLDRGAWGHMTAEH